MMRAFRAPALKFFRIEQAMTDAGILLLCNLCYRTAQDKLVPLKKSKMTSYQIRAENIKCMGCVTNIRENLLRMEGVVSVEADVKTQLVSVSAIAVSREAIANRLAELGYPEKGHNTLLNKAKTFLSCTFQKLVAG